VLRGLAQARVRADGCGWLCTGFPMKGPYADPVMEEGCVKPPDGCSGRASIGPSGAPSGATRGRRRDFREPASWRRSGGAVVAAPSVGRRSRLSTLPAEPGSAGCVSLHLVRGLINFAKAFHDRARAVSAPVRSARLWKGALPCSIRRLRVPFGLRGGRPSLAVPLLRPFRPALREPGGRASGPGDAGRAARLERSARMTSSPAFDLPCLWFDAHAGAPSHNRVLRAASRRSAFRRAPPTRGLRDPCKVPSPSAAPAGTPSPIVESLGEVDQPPNQMEGNPAMKERTAASKKAIEATEGRRRPSDSTSAEQGSLRGRKRPFEGSRGPRRDIEN